MSLFEEAPFLKVRAGSHEQFEVLWGPPSKPSVPRSCRLATASLRRALGHFYSMALAADLSGVRGLRLRLRFVTNGKR